MGKKMEKLILLMWKNWKLQLRHPVQTLFEILVPVFFCAILVLVRSLVDTELVNEKIFPKFESINESTITKIEEICYSPNGAEINTVMGMFSDLSIIKLKLRGFQNEGALESYLINSNTDKKIGIVFPDSTTDIPNNVDVTIRFPSEIDKKNLIVVENWRTNLIYPLLLMPGPRDINQSHGATPSYYDEGFLTIQSLISQALVEYFYKKENKDSGNFYNTFMQRYPYPQFVNDPVLPVLEQMIGLIIVLAFVYTSISTIKVITAEKEKQLKESMKIMGLPSWLHWTAWFLKSILFMLISIIIMVILFKGDFFYEEGIPPVFPKCDPLIMFIFLFLYSCATITFCFAVSVFFSKANLASGIGGVMFFLFFVPYSVSQNKYQYLSKTIKIFSSFLANSAMGFGFRILCMFESTDEGLQWSNLWRTATPDDNLVMGEILVMLLVDAILYLCIALYVEAIFPGKYGVPKKWNFIFTSIASKWKIQGEPSSARGSIIQDPSTYEEEPEDLKPGIEIKHLRKVYPGKKVAVNDFSLKMFENQITVLLGHNGAGKTTTMSMLTGMFPPTSGTAVVNGHDIRTNMNQVRESLGLCPQHNILFDELTVAEHIYFYSKLKGMRPSEIGKEIDEYLKLLQLEDKRNKKSSTLSGGMKRKLSVAVAFCGNSKVVMLDEPTAGMDPAARRALWEMVESQKEGRTIMLTTHFMDEADLLGDRIAIMSGGSLQCCGSSYFLKKKYGAGYHLIMDKSYNCDVEAVTKVLRSHIPGIKVESNIGSELSYLLNEEDSAVFQDMLRDIENNSAQLGIRSYGISLTTLEEVFMKVGAEDHIIEKRVASEVNHTVQINENRDRRFTVENSLLTGYKLRKNQFIAMFMKRALSTLRSWPLLALQLIVPVLLLIFAIQAAKQSAIQELPKLKISLESYRKPITVLRTGSTDEPQYKIASDYLANNNWAIKDLQTSDLITEILKITEEDLSTLRMHYIVGVEIESNNTLTGWFNNDPFHSPPLALSLIMNIFVKQLGPQFQINIYNHPLPYLLSSKFRMMNQGNNMGFQLAFNIGFCMSFISAFYVLFYIRERVCKCKHLQFVSGVNIIIFWMASYIWDWITFAMTIIVLLITLICFQEEGFKSMQDIGHLILVFAVFGFSMLPLIYITSFIFNLPSSGFIRVILFTMICGTFAFMVVEILSVEAFKLTHYAKVLDWICTFVPHYSMSTAIKNINLEYLRFTNCKKAVDFCMNYKLDENDCWTIVCLKMHQCCESKEDYYKWEKPGILRNILFSFLVGIILLIILFLKEYKIFTLINYIRVRYITFGRKKKSFIESPDDDSDVIEETNKIRALTENEIKGYNLVLKNVTKYYGNFLAVNGVCLSVKGYECFGLLGVNGAGKTSTFQMMTGDTAMSNGDIYVNGLNIKSQMKQINELTGYCPQFDALLDDLTARETIKMFGILRGFTVQDCLVLAEKLAAMFDFKKHLDKQVRDLSGGNKRKLSTAIALVGDPPILYLDEPTTGMDPATKRYLWDALCHVRDNGKCLILTSHSMEECEALCTRLAIMVNGRFKCLGSTQHLKNKFSRGYTLIIKLRKRPTSTQENSYQSNVEEYVKTLFPSAVVREKHQELIAFYIETMLPWSTLFGILEEAKSSLDIEDYSLGQSSLEQVFLSFTSSQSVQD